MDFVKTRSVFIFHSYLQAFKAIGRNRAPRAEPDAVEIFSVQGMAEISDMDSYRTKVSLGRGRWYLLAVVDLFHR